MTASGGPNAATYMWYSDIATATAWTMPRNAALVGVVACASSATITVCGVATGSPARTALDPAARRAGDYIAPTSL